MLAGIDRNLANPRFREVLQFDPRVRKYPPEQIIAILRRLERDACRHRLQEMLPST